MFSKQRDFWTFERARWLSFLLTGLFLCSLPFVCLFTKDQPISIVRGDFPAFYSTAVLMSTGRVGDVYNLKVQREVQDQFWKRSKKTVYPFLYPPYVAVLLAPLGKISPQVAHTFFTLIMIGAFSLAILLAQRRVPLFAPSYMLSWCGLFLLAPVASGLLGGQLVGLSMLCYAGFLFWFCSSDIDEQNEFKAGICLGLWMFKPHYPLMIVAALLFTRHTRFLLGFFPVVVLYYLISALELGFSWPYEYFNALNLVSAAEFSHNSINLISLNGLFIVLEKGTSNFTVQSVLRAASMLTCISLAALLFTLYFKLKKSQQGDETRLQASETFLAFALGPAVVLLSPHTIHYDLALSAFSVARVIQFRSDRSVTLLIALYVLLFYLTTNRGLFPLTPLLLFSIGAFALVLARRSSFALSS